MKLYLARYLAILQMFQKQCEGLFPDFCRAVVCRCCCSLFGRSVVCWRVGVVCCVSFHLFVARRCLRHPTKMGQQIGKACFEEDAVPFLNLPGPAVHAVWSQFNLSAESWGLQIVSFLETTAPLGAFLGLEPAAMQERAEKLFELLDTDGNGIVDALEFLATLAMLSALEPADKVKQHCNFSTMLILF